MHVTFTNSKALQAAALFTAPKDVRPYLQGVWVDCTKAVPMLQATTGSIAAFIRIEAQVHTSGIVMLPPHILTALVKVAAPECELVLHHEEGTATYTLQSPDAHWQWQDMAGYFNITRVVPHSVDLQPCHLDYALAAPFVKAAALLLGKKAAPGAVQVSHDAHSTCYVTIPAVPNFFGLWFPRREAYNPPTTPPAWLIPAQQNEEQSLV